MPKLKLSYFDFDGGRGECVRLILSLGKVPFEDDRINMEGWAKAKASQPYQALPVLYIDGAPLAQSSAICRYVGKLTDMYPSDPFQAAICDEVMETVEEITMLIGATISLPEEEKKTKRQQFVAETLPVYLKGLEARLKSGQNGFYANARITCADFKASDLVSWLTTGILDHVPVDFVSNCAPLVFEHHNRVKQDSRVVAYYAQKASKN